MLFQRVLASAALVLAVAAPCTAQAAFGLGVRMSSVRADSRVDPEETAQRFYGGQIRARLSPRTSVELSLDRHTEDSLDLTQRVRDTPIQASLLLFPVKTKFAPFLLGGLGWYSRTVENLDAGKLLDSISTRQFGYHLGFGAELKLGRHAGVHADYRYTMVHFGDDVDVDLLAPTKSAPGASFGPTGLVSKLLPSYDGSMWTAGVTFYF